MEKFNNNNWYYSNYRIVLLVLLNTFLFSQITVAQIETPLSKRTELTLHGDFTFISNTILGKISNDDGSNHFDPKKDYNLGGINNQFKMGFIDIDNDSTTFNSSSASLNFASKCATIKHVGLYWTASYADSVRAKKINTVKIKLPKDSLYQNISDGIVIHDYLNSKENPSKTYSCYKDITTLVTSQKNPNGLYTIANIAASTTKSNPAVEVGNGLAGGWTMIIIYEDPNKSQKRFYIYDGYVNIASKAAPVVFSFDNFKTIQKGDVKSKIGIVSYEGDKGIQGDAIEILSQASNSYQYLKTSNNPMLNFFNSSITKNGKQVTNRVPASENTLGYDADIFNIKNTDNQLITNNQTQTSFRLSTKNDGFATIAVAFSIEVYEPSLQIVKKVTRTNGSYIAKDETIMPGEELIHTLEIKNKGNDHATNSYIIEPFPEHIEFIPNSVSYSIKKNNFKFNYDKKKRSVNFEIPDKLLKSNAESFKISYAVRVSDNCELLAQLNTLDITANSVTARYNGIKDPSMKYAMGYNDYNECRLATTNPMLMNPKVDLSNCTIATHPQISLQYSNSNESINTNNSVAPGKTIVKDPKKIRDIIDLKAIYFDFDKWDITSKAILELDKIVGLMLVEQPLLKIKIETYTDNRGDLSYNQELSQKRAQSIYQYLIANKINTQRIISYKGYGESNPIVNCIDKNCSEEEYQLNRRSNFIIVTP